MASTVSFNAAYDDSIQPSEHSEVITADHFGLNMSFAWNQVGDIGWQNFDEIAEELGSSTARWPGGADGERYIVPEFDANGDVVWDLDNVKKGNGGNTQSLSGFLDWCDETGTTATIIIPTSIFGAHWVGSDASFPTDPLFNPFADKTDFQSTIDDTTSTEYLNFKAAVKEYVKEVLQAAQDAGNVEIGAFEIGNEYSSFFNAKQYGQIASHMTLFIDEAIREFNDAVTTDPDYNPDPDTLVQTRSNLGSGGGHTVMTFEDLEQRADKIIEQFTPEALAKVDGIISHYYYR